MTSRLLGHLAAGAAGGLWLRLSGGSSSACPPDPSSRRWDPRLPPHRPLIPVAPPGRGLDPQIGAVVNPAAGSPGIISRSSWDPVASCFPSASTAVYLEEYAPDNRVTRFINVNIRNLAGVPSIVYGLLGLTVFVAFFAFLGFPNNGRNIIAGALTLTALILPIVIITSAEALRAVPRSLREGGYGVGASRWQVTRKLVLPAARSGILTGTILALARALGETAPLLLAGAILGTFSSPGGLESILTGPYTVLPMTVYDWSRKPQEEFRELTSAAIIALLLITVSFNALAVLLRNRYQKQ
jgi:phosphate transport system permease protein